MTGSRDPETRIRVARTGGLAVSQNREHMATIGRKGGLKTAENREHMSTLGKKGGQAGKGKPKKVPSA